MKAFLLAGGRGERLRPLTLSMPKCLVPIDGDPILGIWLDLLTRHGVDEVLVNVSQFPEQVERFVAGRESGPRVTVVRESAPLGNAGTVRANRWFVEGESAFWILYSDNLTTVDLARLQQFHSSHDGDLSMGLFEAPDARQAGVVSVDAEGRIVAFEEKPARPTSTLANAGIYLASARLLRAIPHGDVVDFGLHVFPRMAGRLYGQRLEGVLIDVGTPQGLERASRAWAALRTRTT